MNTINDVFWETPFGIALFSLGGLLVLGLLSWVGAHMISYIRSRIILKQKPTVEIRLIKATTGWIEPQPRIRVELKGANVFTRQWKGYYFLEGKLHIPKNDSVLFSNLKQSYEYFMDVNDSLFFEASLPDWSFWENNGEVLKISTFTSYLYINDRKCCLTRCEIPRNVEIWNQ